ncbi:MAG: BMP family ABC transporter substrate-binding protein [Actinobacteria bacterium]|nr:BMP family ABC transporter substrate-binding protein [Actinomycetota bacterium]
MPPGPPATRRPSRAPRRVHRPRRRLRPGRLLALVLLSGATAAVVVSGQGSPGPQPSPVADRTTPAALPGEGIRLCEVTDGLGIRAGMAWVTYKGLVDAGRELGVEPTYVEPGEDIPTTASAIGHLVDEDCDLIVTAGPALAGETLVAARANPTQLFAAVDASLVDPASGQALDVPNVRELTFKLDGAGFLAGYLAAGMTESGVVAAFGDVRVPAVTTALDGFAAGILAYNGEHDAAVQLLGWIPSAQHGPFPQGREDRRGAARIAGGLMARGADVLLAVGQEAGLGAADAARTFPGRVLLIGSETDRFVTAPEYADLWLTSLEKNADVAVLDAARLLVEGALAGGEYVGTLGNGGVSLAPFHLIEPQVGADLQAELADLWEGVVSGDVPVDPRAYAEA